MTKDKEKFERISLSFHQTFSPERKNLSALMKHVAQPKETDLVEIADATGIPTGKSSGKVEPTINYARGMGLIDVSSSKASRWLLQLTPLGKIVLSEDQYIREGFTQWILHLQFCRRNRGAEAWYAVFGESSLALGNVFSEESLKSFLTNKYGKRSNLLGPLVRMYNSEASFFACRALIEDGDLIKRNPAPCDKTHFPGYYYVFSALWDDFFNGEQQVAYEDYERTTHFFATTRWDVLQINRFINYLGDEGLVKIDRQTGNAMILRLGGTEAALKNLYSNLL
jgi:hypothetical protein